ncbi:MAG: MBL fold metallo-hydrolase [Acutalibacteraceae bacterium]|nr:MBL fold metallo-hydrolase [Acutalibacteraceae bacterium]
MDIKKCVSGICATNCYLISGDDFAVVIDPAENDNLITDFAQKNADKKNKAILLTHCHFDHIGGVEALKKIWNCDIVIGEHEAEGLKNPNINFSAMWGSRTMSIDADIKARDGQTLNFGEFTAKVLHTPGHTCGSVCYLCDDVLFSGDTLFNLSVGRTDLPTGSFDTELKSLQSLLLLDDATRVLSGHGDETTIGYEKIHNPYVK